MGTTTQVITVTQPNGPNGAYVESLTELAATAISYDNPTYPTVEAALNHLLYTPLQINFSNNRGVVEIGSVITEVTLSWSYNKSIVSQSINQGIGSLAIATTSQVVTPTAPGLTSNETWTLTANDGTDTYTASTSVVFEARVYFGVSPNTSLTNAEILALGNSPFATARNLSTTYNCSGGAYPYYCYPESFGLPSSVVVGGLAFSAYTVTQQAVTNAQGYTQTYNVLIFNNIQTGSDISVVFS